MEKVLLCHLTIHGRLPGLNEYIASERTNKYKAAKLKRDAQNLVGNEIRGQLRGVKISEPVFMVYTFYEPNRKRDHDNVSGFAHKVIQDALVEMGVLRDDGWDEVTGYTDHFALDKKDPRILVEVYRDE